ncbi:MAG: hypothetical protein COB12_03975 [Flavobacterium sp.]|nr:MAG: hypothetical protein COB12_03975 [Flavobacterium sp.]
MKKLILLFVVAFQFVGMAQNGINYKAIIKDGSGNILPNAPITVQFSILQSALLINVYTESHSPTTDANGLIIVNIGEGILISGDYTTIDWSRDFHFLNVQIDTGSGLVDMGNSEFKTVPYALNSFTTNDHYWDKTGSVLFNASEKIGIGTSTPTGKMEISYPSSILDPTLTIRQESGADAFSRINFNNDWTTNYWTIAARSEAILASSRFNIWNGTKDVLSISGDGFFEFDGALSIFNSTLNGITFNTIANNAIQINSAGNNGLQIDAATNDGIVINNAGNIGLNIGTSGNEGIFINSAVTRGVLVNDVINGNGLQVNSAGANGLNIGTAGSEGIYINSAATTGVLVNNAISGNGLQVNSAGVDGLYVGSAIDDGVHVASANDKGGVFIGTIAGVHAESSIDINPDLILGGTANTSTGDDGIITSDPAYSSSDIRIKSNDAVVIHLDQDNDEDGSFQIKNDIGTTIFDIDEYGNTTIKKGYSTTAGDGFTYRNFNNSILFNVDLAGDALLFGNLTENSDRRLKKDIENLPYGLTEILQLQPKAYNWKNRENTHKSLGLIAQEVQPIIKEIVKAQKNEQKTLGISYTQLIPILINAIKEQQEIIENSEARITNYEKDVSGLKNRLSKIEALLINNEVELVSTKN